MRILGLDSATDACSAAVLQDGSVVAHRFETMRRGHAEVLMPLVRDVMRTAGLSFEQLDLLATTVGPGGFTGLRIGLASARALALASRKPLIGVTTLEAVAQVQPEREEPLLVALDTKRADIYVQLFDSANAALSDPDALLPADIAAWLPDGPIAVGGSARRPLIEALPDRTPPFRELDGPAFPDAATVAAIGAERFEGGATQVPPRPLYLRPPDARLPGEAPE